MAPPPVWPISLRGISKVARGYLRHIEGSPFFSKLRQAQEASRLRAQGLHPITRKLKTDKLGGGRVWAVYLKWDEAKGKAKRENPAQFFDMPSWEVAKAQEAQLKAQGIAATAIQGDEGAQLVITDPREFRMAGKSGKVWTPQGLTGSPAKAAPAKAKAAPREPEQWRETLQGLQSPRKAPAAPKSPKRASRKGGFSRALGRGLASLWGEGGLKQFRMRRNPEYQGDKLTESFHGRPPKEVIDHFESEEYPSDLAELGILISLEVINPYRDAEGIEINFPLKGEKDIVRLCASDEHNLHIIGGDQSFPLDKLLEGQDLEDAEKKSLVDLGEVEAISYRTDKHHLEDTNGKVEDWRHEFGEDGGEKPLLVYDRINQRLMLVGGSYTIEDRGIVN